MLGTVVGIVFLSAFLNTVGRIVAHPIYDYIQASGWLDPDSYFIMSEYCEDITEKARKGHCHDFFTRDDKIESLVDILNLHEKSNPCIVGNPGVGKTALVEGLAYRIVNGNIDEKLKNKKILKINIAKLISGKRYSTGASPLIRLRAILNEAKNDKSIILFIDDIYQITQIPGAAKLIKAYIENHDLKIIASVNDEEYAMMSENTDFYQRYTHVFLEEPSKFDTFRILQYLKSDIEQKYNLTIYDEVLMDVIELTGKYMKNKFYPNKAIDILNLSIVRAQKNTSKFDNEVTKQDVMEAISKYTNIPVGELTPDEAEALHTMNERVKQVIIGQDKAVDTVCNAVKSGRIGVCDDNKPRASFLFLGPSGVGKSELARVLGDEIGSLINIDMLNYSSRNSLDNLISSGGGTTRSELIEKIIKNPYSVVIFDNIDKAHEDILNMLSGILDRGFLIDSNGCKIDFTNAIIIMSSDTGENSSMEQISQMIDKNILRKVDDVIIFNSLRGEDYKSIAKIKLSKLEGRFYSQGIHVKVSDEVIDYLCSLEAHDFYGARKIEKQFCDNIQYPISDLIAKGDVESGDTVICELVDGKIEFEIVSE